MDEINVEGKMNFNATRQRDSIDKMFTCKGKKLIDSEQSFQACKKKLTSKVSIGLKNIDLSKTNIQMTLQKTHLKANITSLTSLPNGS